MNNTFTVPASTECRVCHSIILSLDSEGIEFPYGTHNQCMICKTIFAVVPDGEVICTLGCDFNTLGSHPCN